MTPVIQAERMAANGNEEGSDLSEAWAEEVLFESPLDQVDAYVQFATTLGGAYFGFYQRNELISLIKRPGNESACNFCSNRQRFGRKPAKPLSQNKRVRAFGW